MVPVPAAISTTAQPCVQAMTADLSIRAMRVPDHCTSYASHSLMPGQ